MSKVNRVIERSDIMDMDAYAQLRRQRRLAMVELKRRRRVPVGPYATAYFENFDTMLHQVHEMLHTERGGEAQLADELAAYNPLIPKGSELVATLMLEMADAGKRKLFLSDLGGIEDAVALEVGGEVIPATPERDVERTSEDGKTSAVHFLHFRFSPAMMALFKTPGTRVLLSVNHPNYGHAAVLSEGVKSELAGDL